MNKQKDYVPPSATIYRVEMEANIAVTPLSAQFTGEIDDWEIESDPVGNATGEGGNAYVPWN
jgi:hypothetical protein